MKTSEPLSQSLLVLLVISFLGSSTFAQHPGRLPPELNERSSLTEIVNWLDRSSFTKARVGFHTGETEADDFPSPFHDSGTPAENPVFSQGFRLGSLAGCTLTLKNGDMRMIRLPNSLWRNKIDDRYSAQLIIPLDRLSPTKGKGPWRHTKNPEKAWLIGAWRTEFKHRGFFSRHDVVMSFDTPGKKDSKWTMTAETLMFTFDDQETSQQFDAAFRQAIRLCQ